MKKSILCLLLLAALVLCLSGCKSKTPAPPPDGEVLTEDGTGAAAADSGEVNPGTVGYYPNAAPEQPLTPVGAENAGQPEETQPPQEPQQPQEPEQIAEHEDPGEPEEPQQIVGYEDPGELEEPQQIVGYAAPAFVGFGLGIIGSRFLLFFIKLSRHCKRGTSQSTFMLGWESGIAWGIGLGYALFEGNPTTILLTSLGLVLGSLLLYNFVHNWFVSNKNR